VRKLITSPSLSSGALSRDPLARNDGVTYRAADRGGFFPSAVAIAEISGFMKKPSLAG
jgi:hypothetical protein